MKCSRVPDVWLLTIMLVVKISYSTHGLRIRSEVLWEANGEETNDILAKVPGSENHYGLRILDYEFQLEETKWAIRDLIHKELRLLNEIGENGKMPNWPGCTLGEKAALGHKCSAMVKSKFPNFSSDIMKIEEEVRQSKQRLTCKGY